MNAQINEIRSLDDHLTTHEGRIVNLRCFEGFDIEEHPGVEETFRVRAHPIQTPASPLPITLYQGSFGDCQKYVRDTLAPKLNLDVDDPHFKAHYTPKPKKRSRKPAEPAETDE